MADLTKKHKHHTDHHKEPIEESSETTAESKTAIDYVKNVEWQKALPFLKQYGWVFCLLVVIFASVWFRAYPIYLPITDEWAQNSVENYYQSQITAQIKAQYPNLPDANMQALVQSEYDKAMSGQKKQIDQQVAETSKQFKKRMQDDDGQTYLLAIDPWLWYGNARNYIENGHWGTEIRDDETWHGLRDGRDGQRVGFNLFTYMIVLNHKVMNVFTDASIMKAAFYLPLLLITLAAIGAFIIGRKIGGNLAGVTAGVIVGIHSALLNRTVAGFSDTDNIIAFGELVAVAVFVIAFSEKKEINRWIYAVLSGLAMAVYALGHSSWWHIFDFLLGALGVWFIYQVWLKRIELKKGLATFLMMDDIKKIWQLGVIFVLTSWLFRPLITVMIGGEFFSSLKPMILNPFVEPFAFMKLKEVAITSIWPNVLTTVAELNRVSMNSIIGQTGGKLLFILSLVGVAILLLKKEKGERKYLFYGVLLAFWYIGAIYAARSSVRFVAFLVPAFALGISAFVYFAYDYLSKWADKGLKIKPIITKTLVIILIIVLVFMPLSKSAENTAKNEVPSMNDAWYDALLKIQHDSNDGIITSWWDFGHWFVAVSQRKVTFDGGSQGKRIHWVGRTLREDNETQSIGILRMLNCAQEEAPLRLSEMLGGTIHNDVEAIDIMYSIFSLNKEEARQVYLDEGLTSEQAEELLGLTHCDNLIKQYYITSEDMIGKAGVWAHFGSWDFHKAAMFNQVKNKPVEEGKNILIEKFSLSEEEADRIYYEIQSADGDSWISPWPGYLSGVNGCSKEENMLTCIQGVQGQQIKMLVDLDTMTVEIPGSDGMVPNSIVYAVEDETIEKQLEGKKAGFSLVLIPSGEGYRSLLSSQELANSIFTRTFFMNGHGLKHFNKFDDRTGVTGVRIVTWTVDWEGTEPNNVYFQTVPESEETVIEEVINDEPVAEIDEQETAVNESNEE